MPFMLMKGLSIFGHGFSLLVCAGPSKFVAAVVAIIAIAVVVIVIGVAYVYMKYGKPQGGKK